MDKYATTIIIQRGLVISFTKKLNFLGVRFWAFPFFQTHPQKKCPSQNL